MTEREGDRECEGEKRGGDSDDRNELDSSDGDAVSDEQPDNQFQALCLERSDSDTSSLNVDFGIIMDML